MERQTVTANFINTICWNGESIVDWAGGQGFFLNGELNQFGTRYSFGDSVVTSADGAYVFIFKKLGTKGLLLKNGELLREINRSDYCSYLYEYPAAFVTIHNTTYLVHCPNSYNRLEFENVETGELATDISERDPDDMFHSRLEISPNGLYLMSRGWIWHPLDMVVVYNIQECLKNPLLLDRGQFHANGVVEFCTASFVDDSQILLGTSDEIIDYDAESLPVNSICLWNFQSNEYSRPVKVIEPFGNLIAINRNYAWDLYLHPKIIDVNTGKVIASEKTVNSGQQSSSILTSNGNYPPIAYNRETKQIAIKGHEKIEILTPSNFVIGKEIRPIL